MNYSNLSKLQISAIQEICNIGSGNAATALSLMLNRKIGMNVPSADVVPFEDIVNCADAEEVSTGILVKVYNEAPGYVLVVFDNETTFDILKQLSNDNPLERESDELNEMEISILEEMGNILTASFMRAISDMTKFNITPSVPAVARDILPAILSSIFIESGEYGDYVLQLETDFTTKENKSNGYFYFIPIDDSLEKILKALGVN